MYVVIRHYSSLRRVLRRTLASGTYPDALLPSIGTGVARSSSRKRLRSSPTPPLPTCCYQIPPRCRGGQSEQYRSLGGAPPSTLGHSRPFQAALWGVPGQLTAGRPRFNARVGSASLSYIYHVAAAATASAATAAATAAVTATAATATAATAAAPAAAAHLTAPGAQGTVPLAMAPPRAPRTSPRTHSSRARPALALQPSLRSRPPAASSPAWPRAPPDAQGRPAARHRAPAAAGVVPLLLPRSPPPS